MTTADHARAAVADLGLVAAASEHLTAEVAIHLPFEDLAAFKTALKRFFSHAPWTEQDADGLSALVTPHVSSGWWEHDLGSGLVLAHGIRDGSYLIDVAGEAEAASSIFDRVLHGPVVPEQTPHPRKVKFHVGGTPAPGAWHRRGEEIDDPRVAALMKDETVTDVMVAGDFVTVGLRSSASWEEHLEPVLERVTELFWEGEGAAGPARTREELLEEAGHLPAASVRAEDLHLMSPDDPAHRRLLIDALDSEDARRRRAAVVTLALSDDGAVAGAAVVTGFRDDSRIVRRAAVDAAADREDDEYRLLFEEALDDADPWIRWRAVRALRELGVDASRDALVLAAVDEDFRVRYEAVAALEERP